MTNKLSISGCPAVDRKVGISISGLEQWKDGIVTGATVKVEIIQDGKTIHSEVFSGKATRQFTRFVVIKAGHGELITIHDRPDLPSLKVLAEFASEQQPLCGVKAKTPEESLHEKLDELVAEKIAQMLKPGGLLHGR